jgi:CRP/FNR family transcriptional regulator
MNQSPPHASFRTRCDQCAIHNRAICSRASSAAAQELQSLSRIRRFSAGQVIIGERTQSGFLGNVVSGMVKLCKTLEDGRQQVVGLLFPSDFFGRPFEEQSPFSFEAATDVEICVFERQAFETLLERFPEVEHELLVQVLTELDAAREWMVLLGCQSAREKVASFLLMLLRRSTLIGCEKAGKPDAPIVTFPVSRRDVALYLGTTPETVSRQVQWMSRNNIIKIIDGQTFEITNPQKLALTAAREEWLDQLSA